jgi:hypothetical protein
MSGCLAGFYKNEHGTLDQGTGNVLRALSPSNIGSPFPNLSDQLAMRRLAS